MPGSIRRLLAVSIATFVFVSVSASNLFATDRPVVVAVNYPLAYFATRLGGDEFMVRYPVPAGQDPVFWRPSIDEIGAIRSADLILINGAGFAAWVEKTALPRSRVIDTSRDFADRFIQTATQTHSHGPDGAHSHGTTASYTWLDQTLAERQAKAVARGLKRLRPDAAAGIDARLDALLADLADLDAAASALKDVSAGISIVATHPLYDYFARAYGLSLTSLVWEASAVPNARQLSELRRLVKDKEAAILLWEYRPPEAAREAVAAAGVKDMVFPPLAAPPEAGDYVSVLAKTIETLKGLIKTLQGS